MTLVDIRILAAALLLSMASGSALHASPVTVTGGYTSFSGVVGGTDVGITQTLNSVPFCSDSGCENLGVANVTFGSPQSQVVFQNFSPFPNTANGVQFLPAAPQDVVLVGPSTSSSFLLGQLTFTNGTWTGDASFGFTLQTHSLDPAFDGKQLTDTLVMRLTLNDFVNKTPEQNADLVYFLGNTALGSARAYELADSPNGQNTVTVDLIGFIDDLHLLAFSNPQGGFVDPSVNPALATPLPATLPLFASGLAALGLLGWRGKRKGAAIGA